MANDERINRPVCSFCGKPQEQVRRLVAGPGVFICDECVELCREIIEEDYSDATNVELEELPKPQEMMRILNEYVIGQARPKRIWPWRYTTTISASRPLKKTAMMWSCKRATSLCSAPRAAARPCWPKRWPAS